MASNIHFRKRTVLAFFNTFSSFNIFVSCHLNPILADTEDPMGIRIILNLNKVTTEVARNYSTPTSMTSTNRGSPVPWESNDELMHWLLQETL